MQFIDWWAFLAALSASFFLALRANMLKPSVGRWVNSPTCVYLAIAGVSIALVGAALSIWGRAHAPDTAHASGREAVIYSALAVASALMFVNVLREGRAENAAHTLSGWLHNLVRH